MSIFFYFVTQRNTTGPIKIQFSILILIPICWNTFKSFYTLKKREQFENYKKNIDLLSIVKQTKWKRCITFNCKYVCAFSIYHHHFLFIMIMSIGVVLKMNSSLFIVWLTLPWLALKVGEDRTKMSRLPLLGRQAPHPWKQMKIWFPLHWSWLDKGIGIYLYI